MDELSHHPFASGLTPSATALEKASTRQEPINHRFIVDIYVEWNERKKIDTKMYVIGCRNNYIPQYILYTHQRKYLII